MSNERPPPTTLQALAPSDELKIAQQQYADAKKKHKNGYNRAVAFFLGGIPVAGIGGGLLLGTAAGVCPPAAAVIGGFLFLSGLPSALAALTRMITLDDALDGARERVADIKKTMLLDDCRHWLKTIAEATASPPAAILDVTVRLSVPQATPASAAPPAASVEPPVPAADAQPVRPATASQTQDTPGPA